MSDSIKISAKHGVNPSSTICSLCGNENGELLLVGGLHNDDELLGHIVHNNGPCHRCREYVQKGIILIGVDDNYTEECCVMSGHFAVVSGTFVEKLFADVLEVEYVLKARVAFVPWRVIAALVEE